MLPLSCALVANSHDNTSFSAQATFATGYSPDSVAVVDINGDGKPDLIVSDFYSNAISLLPNATPSGSATPVFAAQQIFAAGSNPFSVVTADINGDGKPDVMFVNSGDNTVSTLLNTQYRCDISGSPATGTIAHDYIFGDRFE